MGVYGKHVGESALKADSGRKIPCRAGESNLRQRRDGQMVYQRATSLFYVWRVMGNYDDVQTGNVGIKKAKFLTAGEACRLYSNPFQAKREW